MASRSKGPIGLFNDVKRETKKITWPSKEDVKKALVAVGTICAIYIVLIAISDFVFKSILTEILFNL